MAPKSSINTDVRRWGGKEEELLPLDQKENLKTGFIKWVLCMKGKEGKRGGGGRGGTGRNARNLR